MKRSLILLLLVTVGHLFAQQFVYPVGNPKIQPTLDFVSGNGYRISQTFMNADGHTGVDLENGSEGGEVRAIGAGVVILRLDATLSKGFGNVVMIRHSLPEGTVYSVYAHLAENTVLVNQGDTINAPGEPIGRVDCTGHTESSSGTVCLSNGAPGPHLHFAVKHTPILGCAYLRNALTCKSGETFDDYLDPLQFVQKHRQTLFINRIINNVTHTFISRFDETRNADVLLFDTSGLGVIALSNYGTIQWTISVPAGQKINVLADSFASAAVFYEDNIFPKPFPSVPCTATVLGLQGPPPSNVTAACSVSNTTGGIDLQMTGSFLLGSSFTGIQITVTGFSAPSSPSDFVFDSGNSSVAFTNGTPFDQPILQIK